jgi:hypothetical protein
MVDRPVYILVGSIIYDSAYSTPESTARIPPVVGSALVV